MRTEPLAWLGRAAIAVLLLFIGALPMDVAAQKYRVNIFSSNNDWGVVTKDPDLGEYEAGAIVTIKATPKDGYYFMQWDNINTGTPEPQEVYCGSAEAYCPNFSMVITVDKDYYIRGKFVVNAPPATKYTIKTIIDPEGAGTVTGGEGSYELGKTVELTATPTDGWMFYGWGDGEERNPRTVTVRDSEAQNTYTALFKKAFTLTLPVEGNGSITGDVEGTYFDGRYVTINANPDASSRFVGWKEDGVIFSKDLSLTFKIESNRTIVAVFEAIPLYTVVLTPTPTEGGTVDGAGTYEEGKKVTIKATHNDGFKFVKWVDEADNEISGSSEYNFTISGNVNYRAVFASTTVPQGTIIVQCDPAEGGSVTGGGSYDIGSTATLVATANDGYRFTGWSDGNTAVSRDVEVTDAKATYVAQFELIPNYTVSVTVEPDEVFGEVTGAGTYRQDQAVTLTATPNSPDYRFVRWKEGGAEISSDNTLMFNITGDRNIVAEFEEVPTFEVKVIDIDGSGTVEGEGKYRDGTKVTLTAKPVEGHSFVGWMINGNPVDENPYKFSISGNVDVEATFKAPHYVITFETEGNGTISHATGEYKGGESITIAATPAGSYFMYWMENGTVYSKQNPCSYNVKAAATLCAVFTDNAALGSEYNPLTINNVVELMDFRNAVNTGGDYKTKTLSNGAEGYYFAITENIDMSSASPWEPIGTGAVPFRGNLDGRFRTLSGMSAESNGYTGLFGSVKGSKIENVVLSNVTVTGSGNHTGAICGYADGAEILNCASVGVVHADIHQAGGICGYAQNTTISGCASSGKVEAGAQAGGICGFAVKNTVVKNCYNANMVSVGDKSSYAGGICGFIGLGGSIESCLNVGVIKADYYGGAIAGSVYEGALNDANPTLANNFYDKQMSVFQAVNDKAYDGAAGHTTNELVGLATAVKQSAWMASQQQNYPMPEMLALQSQEEYLNLITVPINLNETENVAKVLSGIKCKGAWSHSKSEVVQEDDTYKAQNSVEDVFVLSDSKGNMVKYIPVNFFKSDAIIIQVIANNCTVIGLRDSYATNDRVVLVCKPNDTFRLKGWYQNNAEVCKTNTYSFIATESCVLTVECDQAPCILNVMVEGNGTATPSGVSDCSYASQVELEATPDEHNFFAGWFVGGVSKSINPKYKFTITDDCDVVAKFVPVSYYIGAAPDHLSHGEVSGRGSYKYGETVSLVAKAYFGYTFANWTDQNGTVVSTNPNFEHTVDGAMNFVANYTQTLYDIIVLDANGGSIIKEGKINDMQTFHQQFGHGNEVTLVAQPLPGYAFVNWVEGRESVSESPTYTFKALKSRTLKACFRWVGMVSGIEETMAEPFAMKLYPNPATDRVVIEGSAMDMVQVFDMSGRLVHQSAPLAGQTTLEMNVVGFMPGIYVVQVRDAQGQPHTAKLVVR